MVEYDDVQMQASYRKDAGQQKLIGSITHRFSIAYQTLLRVMADAGLLPKDSSEIDT